MPERFLLLFSSRDRVSMRTVFCCCRRHFVVSRALSSLVIISLVFLFQQLLPLVRHSVDPTQSSEIKVHFVFVISKTHNKGGSPPLLHLSSSVDSVQRNNPLNVWPKPVNVFFPERLLGVWISKTVNNVVPLNCVAVRVCKCTESKLSQCPRSPSPQSNALIVFLLGQVQTMLNLAPLCGL